MRTITYDDFLNTTEPCWIHEEDKRKIMEEVGRSKEVWTAKDVLEIEHKNITDKNKIWVILHGKLISEWQLSKVLFIFVRHVLDKTLENLRRTANEKTITMFEKLLIVSGVRKCLAEFDEKLDLDKRQTKRFRDIRNIAMKESFKNCGHRLEMAISMLTSDEDIFNLDDDIDVGAIKYYLNRLTIIIVLATGIPVEMIEAMQSYCIIPYKYDINKALKSNGDDGFEVGAPILLRIIATVIEEEDATDDEEDE